eukprot:gene22658-21325_t
MGVEEAVLYAALVGFSVWLYIGSINGEFVFDDDSAITNNKDVTNPNQPLKTIFSNNFWGDEMG